MLALNGQGRLGMSVVHTTTAALFPLQGAGGIGDIQTISEKLGAMGFRKGVEPSGSAWVATVEHSTAGKFGIEVELSDKSDYIDVRPSMKTDRQVVYWFAHIFNSPGGRPHQADADHHQQILDAILCDLFEIGHADTGYRTPPISLR